jgi:GTP-binding protein
MACRPAGALMRTILGPAPTVAIVGRPNVGKSTLVNRIIGRREAVVDDLPGVTRDRVAYDTEWAGRAFTVLDTGGWDPRGDGLQGAISEIAATAAGASDVVVFVVDAARGATETDAEVARMLRRAGIPVILAANKVDDARSEADATALWSLGLGEPYPVSALHGRGSGELLDAVVAALPDAPGTPPVDQPRRVAIVGRPNVGKSSLLNRLAGEQLALVDAEAGTTRDPVDIAIHVDGTTWQFVDTAGLRRRVRQIGGTDYYASLRTTSAIEAAEVALVVLDASETIAEQDLRVVEAVVEAGRAMVLVANKWDLVDDDRRYAFEREWERELARVSWASRVNISARTGRGVQRLVPAMAAALDAWVQRIPTATLNDFVGSVVAATPPPVRGGKQPKIQYVTQPGVAPPRFVCFTTGPLEPAYRRFLERRLREQFGFQGTPLQISVRAKPKRR